MCQLNIYEGLLLYLAVSHGLWFFRFIRLLFKVIGFSSAQGSYVIVKFYLSCLSSQTKCPLMSSHVNFMVRVGG